MARSRAQFNCAVLHTKLAYIQKMVKDVLTVPSYCNHSFKELRYEKKGRHVRVVEAGIASELRFLKDLCGGKLKTLPFKNVKATSESNLNV